jgi:hypothetical protein
MPTAPFQPPPIRPQWILERVADLGRFAAERHRIHQRRFEQKLPPPWTDDPILREHHFCNVYRRLDRGTKYVEEHILPFADSHPELTVFNACVYRRFNLPETHDALSELFAARHRGFLAQWDEKRAFDFLLERMRRGIQVFTTAWRVQPPPGVKGEGASLRAQCSRITEAWNRQDRINQKLRSALTLYHAAAILEALPGVGPFVAPEIALDLNYTQTILRFSEDDFVRVGPGARPGLDMMVASPLRGYHAYEGAVYDLHRTQDDWLGPAGFPGPRLTVCDCQFLCCEFRKYLVKRETGYHKRKFTPRTIVRTSV